jgi:hypothetical protein
MNAVRLNAYWWSRYFDGAKVESITKQIVLLTGLMIFVDCSSLLRRLLRSVYYKNQCSFFHQYTSLFTVSIIQVRGVDVRQVIIIIITQ